MGQVEAIEKERKKRVDKEEEGEENKIFRKKIN